jgi:hypothetical protein
MINEKSIRLISSSADIYIGLIYLRLNNSEIIIKELKTNSSNWSCLIDICKEAEYSFKPGIKIPTDYKVNDLVFFRKVLINDSYEINWINKYNKKNIMKLFCQIKNIDLLYNTKFNIDFELKESIINFKNKLKFDLVKSIRIINLSDYLNYVQETILRGRVLYKEFRSNKDSDFGHDCWQILCSSYQFENKTINNDSINRYRIIIDDYLVNIIPKRTFYFLVEQSSSRPQEFNFDKEDNLFFENINSELKLFYNSFDYFDSDDEKSKRQYFSNLLIDHWEKKDLKYEYNFHFQYLKSLVIEYIFNDWANFRDERYLKTFTIELPNKSHFDLEIEI